MAVLLKAPHRSGAISFLLERGLAFCDSLPERFQLALMVFLFRGNNEQDPHTNKCSQNQQRNVDELHPARYL